MIGSEDRHSKFEEGFKAWTPAFAGVTPADKFGGVTLRDKTEDPKSRHSREGGNPGRPSREHRELPRELLPSPVTKSSVESRISSSEFRVSDFDFRQLGRSVLGFTLLELMMVMTLILILVSFALPAYHVAIQRAREAVLRDDLMTMRQLIDEYTADKQQPPQSLQDLVDTGYLRGGIPNDPMTGSADTWKVDVDQVPIGGDEAQSGIVDVHSGSEANSLEGTPYSSW